MSVGASLSDLLPPDALSGGMVAGPWERSGRAPEAVVHPESTAEVAATLRWAGQNGVRVVPVGSGRRVRGGWQEYPFIVLSTRRLAGIEIYEPADLTLTAGAGTLVGDLDGELRRHRQWLPFDPPAIGARSLGGLVASGESGPLWMGYGELRNHVLGMTVVCGDGRTLQLGGRVVKNVAGFDLLKPVVGSRGRLCVVTAVCIRAFPVPAAERILVLRADRASQLGAAARAIGSAPVLPVSSVLLAPAPMFDAGAALVVRLHGSAATVRADHSALQAHADEVFEQVVDPGVAETTARDHASIGDVVIGMSLLPSRLIQALEGVHELPGAELAADTYAGTARIACGSVDAGTVAGMRAEVEALGGTLTVRSTMPSADLAAVQSKPSREEVELGEGLERVFDPGGVLWSPNH